MKNVNPKIISFFSALADETRLKILLSLAEGPKSVSKVYSEVGKEKMTFSAISHQLKDMCSLEIVTFEKNGKERIFQLSDKFCWCILKDALDHFNHKARCKKCSTIKKSYTRKGD